MGTVTIQFKNLCAFFTKKLDNENQLMVGLPDLSDFFDVPEEDWHTPRITIETQKMIINPNGEEILVDQTFVYEGFPGRSQEHSDSDPTRLIFGDIRLEMPSGTQGIERTSSAGFILDFENTLHPADSLDPKPSLCNARFHFRNGTLSGLELDDINFAASNNPDVVVRRETSALHAGLSVGLAESEYAVLRFLNSDTDDFVFIGTNNYLVTIDNAPAARKIEAEAGHEHEPQSHPNHFRFYYKLMAHPPVPQLEPILEDQNPTDDPFCMVGRFGKADYTSAF